KPVNSANTFNVCVIGHITWDLIKSKNITRKLPGGVAYYSSIALKSLGSNVCVVTKTAVKDQNLLTDLIKKGIKIFYRVSQETTFFENIYPNSLDSRIQKVRSIADSFTIEDLPEISVQMFHLGPLTKEDIPLEVLRVLSKKAKISLDIQGFVRKINKGEVKSVDWTEKEEGLTYVDILSTSETEAKTLSGETDVKEAAIRLSSYGIEEVIITRGTLGSLIFSKGEFCTIPSFSPRTIADATGCGDTYIAGYLHKRLRLSNISDSGRFASAIAALKIENFGAFMGIEADVQKFLEKH
ncbi:MAG: PfkB family carbohydrate kinase, partial [Candidatus Hodarchaeota archaeon]